MTNQYTEDYYLRGKQTGLSNYENYSWKPELTYPMAAELMRLMGLERGDKVLDYGCARGYLVAALRSLGINAKGYDISEWAIANCHADAKNHVTCNHSPILLTTFDFIFCKDVLEHCSEAESIIFNIAVITNHALFIVPLAESEGGKYIYPADEEDKTHIHRHTLQGWLELIDGVVERHGLITRVTNRMPTLKKAIEQYPGCAGFIEIIKL